MRRLRWLTPLLPLLALSAVSGCNGGVPKPDPLVWGDADWPNAPIPQPGTGDPNSEDDGGGGEGDGDDEPTSGVFVPDDDVAGVSQCDPWAQDCPEGEKCVAYASTGGDFDANKCVPIGGAGMAGEPCLFSSMVEATDDCDASSYCWDVLESNGTCAAFCMGTPDSPECPPGLECLISNEGAINLCIDNSSGGTGDTGGTDTSTESGLPDAEDPESAISPSDDQLHPTCPDEPEPVVLYMSNDDSNSQASPAIVRRLIHEGLQVDRSRVRLHEFLNYYTIATDYPINQAVRVGMQMRRTNAETGEFGLLLTAKGRLLLEQDRPPLNLVFSVDSSGSMKGERLDLVKQSMRALAGELRTGDVVSMVSWSDTQAVLLEAHPVSGPDDPDLLSAIKGLEAGGSTNLYAGLVSAYELAEAGLIEDGINRVIVMSDGGANAGVTDLAVISTAAAVEDGTGIYLVGVGVGPAAEYSDQLMDRLTDAGKGAYIFIDSKAEAELQFRDRFLSNVAVAARNVRLRVTLPWYFGIKSFHGEAISSDPAEVEPQHLAPNDAMSFHSIIAACDPSSVSAGDEIEAYVEYLDPLTLEPRTDSMTMKLGALVEADAHQLRKADAVVSFAKAIIMIDVMLDQGETDEAASAAAAMTTWLTTAANTLGDDELLELAMLMGDYADAIPTFD